MRKASLEKVIELTEPDYGTLKENQRAAVELARRAFTEDDEEALEQIKNSGFLQHIIPLHLTSILFEILIKLRYPNDASIEEAKSMIEDLLPQKWIDMIDEKEIQE